VTLGFCGLAVAGVMFMEGILTTPARAEVNVNINIGAPPPIVVHERPTMVYLPEPAMYVAVGVPYDVYFISGRYYYLHRDHWFWAPGYNGPWVVIVEHKHLPPGLQKFKVVKLREFRDREYKVYKVQGSSFKGKTIVADPGTYVVVKETGKPEGNPGRGNSGSKGNNGNGNGNGKGKGRG
jgi:hypothetical protein